ncbi:hypothetical protein OHA27_33375 [Streptomyces sp. NBC_01619]|uniref:hypothetical protein n=1 Tax=Streptomyces sp. NBC_01619 TaxID=2975901 RepID=UPI00225842A2|nr:hypothetical protein [Streptomyces sp. NBC_01619]MCX4515128.1 hypothetical protein [Streptomyces sp. NBC_01619]
MRSYFTPAPPGRPPTPHLSLDALQLQRSDSLREATHRAQRSFLVANAVPLAAGIALSSFTDIPAVPVYGQLTLGLVWGILQCGLFVATAWLYETRSTRLCDPVEQSLASGMPLAETSGASPVNESWR